MSAYVYAAVRTPFGRFGGALAERPARRPGRDRDHRTCWPSAPGAGPGGAIGEVVWGNANGAGEDNRNVGRMAVLLAGLPDLGARRRRSTGSAAPSSTPRWSRSRTIETGDADVVLAGGVESMTRAPVGAAQAGARLPGRQRHRGLDDAGLAAGQRRGCRPEWTVSLGEANEQLPSGSAISRERQDEFAAALAQPRRRGLERRASTTTSWCRCRAPELARDEGIRPGTTAEKLAGAQAVVPPGRHHHRRQRLAAQRRRLRGAARLRAGAAPRSAVDPLARIAGRGAHALEPQDFGFAPVEAAEPGAGPGRHRLGRRRRGRAQRGVRRAVAGLRRRLEDRPRDRQRQGRRDRDRPPARRLRRPDPRHPGRSGCASPATAGASPRSASASARASRWCSRTWRRDDRRCSIVDDPDEAVADVPDGATVLVGGFGLAGHAGRAHRRADPAGRRRPDRGQQQRRQRRHRAGRAARRRAGCAR